MPTIARIGPYRVYFYSHDMQEPPHVHVDRDDETAKFWLTPVALAYNIGFRARELRDIQRIVSERSAEYLEAWNDYFGT
ncbi:MAG: DUF4160 domain-containing protein [Phycisphaerae bacterium]|nr:DUF4160 domain-containing protein [Phycisphaerae bacterium]